MQGWRDTDLLAVACLFFFQLNNWVLCFVSSSDIVSQIIKVVVDHFSVLVKGNVGQYNCNMYTGQSCNRQCTCTSAAPTILHVDHLNLIYNFQTCWTQCEEDLQVSNQAVSNTCFFRPAVTLKYQHHPVAASCYILKHIMIMCGKFMESKSPVVYHRWLAFKPKSHKT